ncbi:hypothetical protein IAI18_03445 [Acetobacteraceae bacterium H6797]|nr:hypothetical protein [Acetobacteraceae bacterium H6797]
MTAHWWYVSIAWGAAAVLFTALALGAARRHAAAGRRLALLDTRRDSRQ